MEPSTVASPRPYFNLKTSELEAVAKTDPAGVVNELKFRRMPSAKKLASMLEGTSPPVVAEVTTPQAPPARTKTGINFAALEAKAARLKEQATACHADRLTNTAKRLAQAMHKRLDGDRLKRQADILEAFCATPFDGPFQTGGLIQLAHEASLFECKHISNGYHGYNVENFDKPRHTAPIHNELRALLNPDHARNEAKKSAQIQSEAELRRCDIPGFFPTPPAVIAVMLEQAGDLKGKRVLEPSAGKGDLVKAAMNAGARVRAFEINSRLAQYCQEHVGPVKNADFLEQVAIVVDTDVVLMNPPFERDAAPKHVLHALQWLKSDGRLIAVMPANWASKASANQLLTTLDTNGWELLEIEVHDNAFNGADAFRQTGVSTTIIVITK